LAYLLAAACSTPLTREPFMAAAMIAAVGGLLLAKGVMRAEGAGLNVYLARSALLELVTGAGLAAMLSI
jgi:hypothetical protein